MITAKCSGRMAITQTSPISQQISCLFLEFSHFIMQMAKLKCGEILSYTSYSKRCIAVGPIPEAEA